MLLDNTQFNFRDSNIGTKNKKGEEICPITWNILVGIVSNTYKFQ